MEVVTPDATSASSAPSEPTPPPLRSLAQLAADSPAEFTEWQKTGIHPDRKPKESAAPAEATTATTSDTSSASTDASTESASEPTKGKGLKARNAALDTEIASLNEKLRLRREIREELDRLEAPKQSTTPPPAAPSPAKGLVKPNPETFTYGTADPEYVEALTEWKVKSHLAAEREVAARHSEQERLNAVNRDRGAAFQKRIDAATVKHPDYAEVALHVKSPIPAGSLLDAWIWDHKNGAEVLYALHSQPAELTRILALPDLDQIDEVVMLGHRLAGQTVKLATEAPNPPAALGTRSGTGPDAITNAVTKKDVGAYIEEANRRDLAAARGR